MHRYNVLTHIDDAPIGRDTPMTNASLDQQTKLSPDKSGSVRPYVEHYNDHAH
jgi:hypothetical protein